MSFKPFKPPSFRKAENTSSNIAVPQREEAPNPAKRRKLSPADEEDEGGVNRSELDDVDRRPLQILQNPPSPVKHDDAGNKRYYSIVWRKVTSKKNKTWEDDGALAYRGGAVTVYDSKGRRIGGCTRDKPLDVDDTLSVSGKDVQIEAEINYNDFCGIVGRDNNVQSPKDENAVIVHGKVQRKSETQTSKPAPKMSLQEQMRQQIQKKATPKASLLSAAKSSAFRQPLKDTQVLQQTPSEKPIARHDPDAPGALVFKRPSKAPPGKQIVDVVLDPLISKKLRQHQRAGVEFLYECVMGMRNFDGQGCILADDMGLGKTLQTIALIWTLVKQNPIYKDDPVIKKVLIVCPVTLVQNWKKEFRKWLGRDKLGVMSFGDEGSRLSMFDGRNFKVMIVGYERLQKIAEDLSRGANIDLVICDEGHRLKSLQNKSTQAIETLNTTRRIILSGTPIQNDLKEFFAMVNFVNDGVLGTPKSFLKNYEKPIEKSRQPNATEDDIEKGQDRSDELAQLTKPFILRRTADVVRNLLPPKTEYVLFCRPTPGQASLYRTVVQTPMFKTVLGSGSSEGALQMITILKKLCNSPVLLRPKDGADELTQKSSLETLNEMLPSGIDRFYRNQYASKIRLLDELLDNIKNTTNDKIVLVSNYTATLDLMAQLLSSLNMNFKRLDGSVPASKRMAMVEDFNRAKREHCFAFLLSAKAGGVGINLIGANRLILFDVDWNPATDDQAMARIHREGQTKPCYIYRFLIKGGLEERIWQRQVVKRGLADSIMDSGTSGNGKNGQNKAPFSQEELKDLFRLDEREGLRTHDLIGCRCNGVTGKSAAQSPVAEIADIDDLDVNVVDDSEENEPVRTFSFTKASRISEQDLEEQEQSISNGSSPRKHNKARKEQDELQELMTYTHIDTSKVSELEESELLTVVESSINDSCLMDVLRQERDVIPGSIDYIFMKRSGADEEPVVPTPTDSEDESGGKKAGKSKSIHGLMAAIERNESILRYPDRAFS